jgi:predicted dehydrogenase
MSNKVRWGVIGSGGIARRRTIPEGIIRSRYAELVSVWDVAAAINSQVAAQFHVQAADSLDHLLAAEVDAVYVATPARYHYEQALDCARARKHVLCEKPLGMAVAEAEERKVLR